MSIVDTVDRRFVLRSFAQIVVLTKATSLLTACGPSKETPFQTGPYAASKLKQYAQEVDAWTLKNGTRPAQVFPQVQQAIDMLAGRVDPRTKIPFIQASLLFTNDTGSNRLDVVRKTESGNQAIGIILPNGRQMTFDLLSHTSSSASINLNPETQASSIRIPIILKEVSQLNDMPEYYRLYLNEAKKVGATYHLVGEGSEFIPQKEIEANAAEDLAFIETGLHKDSFLATLVDIGSHLRMDGIVFGNWYQDQLSPGIKPLETPDVKAGLIAFNLLYNQGLIIRKGGMFVWALGQAPNIESGEFLKLVKAVSTLKAPSFN